MAGSVVITGLGPVTSIGVGCDALWTAMGERRCAASARSLVVDAGKAADVVVASMPADDRVPGLAKHLTFLAGQDAPGYRELAYALLAIELALNDAGIEQPAGPARGRSPDGDRIGLVQAFEAPGVERTVQCLFQMMTMPPPGGPPPVYDALAPSFYNMQPFVFVHLAGKAFGLHGFSTSVHNACTSGAFAIDVAARRIRDGTSDVMLVAAGEAFETGVRLEWFRRLNLYAGAPQDCRPFDSESGGFFVGEGAAAMVLESASRARQRGARVYGEYLGGGFSHQAWKQTVPDIRAARLRGAISEAMARAEIAPEDVDLIVPHGAATPMSDGYEAECLSQALGSQPSGSKSQTVVSAFKPYVGHMLAGSGVVDTVCGLLAMHHGAVPATLHADPGRVRLPFPLVTERIERPVRTMLKLSTGFTGHDAALVFRRAEP